MIETRAETKDAAPRVDVCLAMMPYAAVERPAMGLSILKNGLEEAGLRAAVTYGNIAFSQEVGVFIHHLVGKVFGNHVVGEWTFARSAFPEHESDTEAFFNHISHAMGHFEAELFKAGSPEAGRAVLERLRRQAGDFIDRFARRVLARGPRIVGASSTFQQHCASLALLRRVKELDPEVVTVIGGANCESSMGVVTHQHCPWVDYVVSGEADTSFPRLCRRILDGAPGHGEARPPLPEGVIGPEHRQGGEAVYARLRSEAPRARLFDMDESPIPEFSDYMAEMGASPVRYFVEPGLVMESSRGCWWGAASHCTFCGLNGGNMAFRSKSPERVLVEFDELSRRYDSKRFLVVDNILDLGYFKTVLPALAERKESLDIFYETKANLTRDQVRMLAEAGIRWIQPGIESLDNSILRLIAKGSTVWHNLQLLKWTREFGINTGWLILYDIPEESDEAYAKMADWLPLVFHLQPPIGITFIQFHRFSPYWFRAVDYGLELSPDRAYAHIYPWPADALDDFAYFFDDYRIEREHLEDGSIRSPGLLRVMETLMKWMRGWSGEKGNLPVLVAEPEGDALRIRDGRECRSAPEFLLKGLERQVHEACDQAQTAASLKKTLRARGFSDESGVEDAVARLVSDKLLLELEGRYFSLASRGPLVELARLDEYPGGRTRHMAEVAGEDVPPDLDLNRLALSGFGAPRSGPFQVPGETAARPRLVRRPRPARHVVRT